jgi:hypothetical protein
MAPDSDEPPPTLWSWVQVAAGWILVGIPLLWGVFITFQKAAVLFK